MMAARERTWKELHSLWTAAAVMQKALVFYPNT